MKTKFWILAVSLLALVLCGAVMLSYAQETAEAPSAGWHGHGQHHMGWMAKQLSLTDAQKTQIKSMMQSQRTTLHPLMQQLAENRKAMLAATANGAFDQAKITALAGQQAQVIAQLTVEKESMQHQIYTQVLTPDQRVTADQLRAKQMARIDQRLQKLSQPATETQQQ